MSSTSAVYAALASVIVARANLGSWESSIRLRQVWWRGSAAVARARHVDAPRDAGILPALPRVALPIPGGRALLGMLELVLWIASWNLPCMPKRSILQYLRFAAKPHLPPAKASA